MLIGMNRSRDTLSPIRMIFWCKDTFIKYLMALRISLRIHILLLYLALIIKYQTEMDLISTRFLEYRSLYLFFILCTIIFIVDLYF